MYEQCQWTNADWISQQGFRHVFLVYQGFEMSVANVSRRNEEYKFQQLKKQYAGTLEEELDKVAKDVLKKYKNEKQVNEMDQMFHQFIRDYLHRFIQKINDL